MNKFQDANAGKIMSIVSAARSNIGVQLLQLLCAQLPRNLLQPPFRRVGHLDVVQIFLECLCNLAGAVVQCCEEDCWFFELELRFVGNGVNVGPVEGRVLEISLEDVNRCEEGLENFSKVTLDESVIVLCYRGADEAS